MATETALATLDHVWGVLAPLGHPLAVMGGISLAAWGHVRATRDVDLLIAVDASQIESIVNVLRSHGCRPKRSPPLIRVGEHHFIQLLYTPPGEFYDVQFDLLLAESDLQKSATARRVRRDVPGVTRPIDVLHCDDLILFKLVAGRMIDRADAAMLLRENRDLIDSDYLLAWVSRLNLEADFASVWQEAFPAEEPPTLDN
jgi:Nucleotidyl transferase AbiEii toxin, Type IV TA system